MISIEGFPDNIIDIFLNFKDKNEIIVCIATRPVSAAIPFIIGISLFSIGSDATSAIKSVITKSKQFISAISPFPIILIEINTAIYKENYNHISPPFIAAYLMSYKVLNMF